MNNKTSLDEMVNRFLGWKLPQTFSPDCGISFDGRGKDAMGYEKSWPVGTNLFTADEARAMLVYLLAASPSAPAGEAEGTRYAGACPICHGNRASQPASLSQQVRESVLLAPQPAPQSARDLSDEDMDAVQTAIKALDAGDIGYHAFCDRIIALARPAPQSTVTDEQIDAICAAVRLVFGGMSGTSDEAKWQDMKRRAREEVRAVLALASSAQCVWHADEDGVWHPSCGGDPWVFTDGGPVENHVEHCMRCGKHLATKSDQPLEGTP